MSKNSSLKSSLILKKCVMNECSECYIFLFTLFWMNRILSKEIGYLK